MFRITHVLNEILEHGEYVHKGYVLHRDRTDLAWIYIYKDEFEVSSYRASPELITAIGHALAKVDELTLLEPWCFCGACKTHFLHIPRLPEACGLCDDCDSQSHEHHKHSPPVITLMEQDYTTPAWVGILRMLKLPTDPIIGTVEVVVLNVK